MPVFQQSMQISPIKSQSKRLSKQDCRTPLLQVPVSQAPQAVFRPHKLAGIFRQTKIKRRRENELRCPAGYVLSWGSREKLSAQQKKKTERANICQRKPAPECLKKKMQKEERGTLKRPKNLPIIIALYDPAEPRSPDRSDRTTAT